MAWVFLIMAGLGGNCDGHRAQVHRGYRGLFSSGKKALQVLWHLSPSLLRTGPIRYRQIGE